MRHVSHRGPLAFVAAIALLPVGCFHAPSLRDGPPTSGPRPAGMIQPAVPGVSGQCEVQVRNRSDFPMDVSYGITSSGGGYRTGYLGVLSPDESGIVRVLCGETVHATGTAMGRSTQRSAHTDRDREVWIDLRIRTDGVGPVGAFRTNPFPHVLVLRRR